MTKAELIEKLLAFPDDAPVCIGSADLTHGGLNWNDIEEVLTFHSAEEILLTPTNGRVALRAL